MICKLCIRIKKIYLCIILLASLYIAIYLLIPKNDTNEEDNYIFSKVSENVKCPVANPKLIGHENVNKAKMCSIQDWIIVENGQWRLNESITNELDNIQCSYREIIRIDDFKFRQSAFISLKENEPINFETFEVQCNAKNKRGQNSIYNNVYMNFWNKIDNKYIKDMNKNLDEPNCNRMNILLFSYDSVSRISWLLRLRNSTDYMLNKMKFQIMKGFNIIGEGTPACIIPVLTGKTEEELPTTLRNNPNGTYVDQAYPFIWKELHEKGYVSLFNEDLPSIGTFTYRLRGMSNKTTTHYTRAFQRTIEIKNGRDNCVGGKTRHQNNMNFIRDMYSTYKDYANIFIYSHLSQHSHDGNANLNQLDGELYEFLKENYENGNFGNTAIFAYSDHGSRFGVDRASKQGYFEERLPFLAIYLPERYRMQFSKKLNNLRRNKEILSTPFDIYATIRELTCLPKSKEHTKRSVSFLERFPAKRTCEDCDVKRHYCLCVDWGVFDVNHTLSKFAAEFFVEFLNDMIKSYKICSQLSLKEIESIYYGSNDKGVDFLLKLVTSPNNGIYEFRIFYSGYLASEKHDKKTFTINYSEISRLDKYEKQARCVESLKLITDIRKICNCVS